MIVSTDTGSPLALAMIPRTSWLIGQTVARPARLHLPTWNIIGHVTTISTERSRAALATGLVVILATALAGCGTDDASGGSNDPNTLVFVGADLDDAVPDVAFAAVPDLLVTVSGDVIYAAPDEFAIEGELLPDVWITELGADGAEAVRRAIDAGDAPATPTDVFALVGDDVGPTNHYLPVGYRFRAIEIGPVASFDATGTPLVEWPATASISLADAGDCTILPELEVGEAFETAAADSAFVDGGIVYGVVAAQDWPGAPCD